MGIRTGAHWAIKPSLGHALERTHPLCPNRLAWLFNEGTGNQIIDLAGGTANPGAFGGSPLPTWQPGITGPVLKSNNGGRVTTSVAIGGVFSIVAAVNLAGAPTNHTPILTDNTGNGFDILFPGSSRSPNWHQGTSDYTGTSSLWSLNSWTQLAVTYDGATLSFYVNDRAAGTVAAAGLGNVTLTNSLSNPASFTLNGLIDRLYVWDGICLSAGAIRALYQEPYAPFMPGRVRTWFVLGGAPSFSYAPSGGLVLGGSASPNVTFSPVASGGLTLGGAASPSASFNPPASGGLVLGGSATPALTFTATASGGLTLGGSATPSLAFTATASGGVVFGGSATPNSSSSFSYTASGGIKLGGSASPGVTFAPVASGGLTLGGSATPGVTFAPVASGGLVLGGTATTTFSSGGAIPTLIRPVTQILVGIPDPQFAETKDL